MKKSVSGLARHLFEQTNIPADIERSHINDRVHTAIARLLQSVDDLLDEVGASSEELRPNLPETRGAGTDMLVRQSEAEARGVDGTEDCVDGMRRTLPYTRNGRWYGRGYTRGRCLLKKLATC